MFSIENAMHGNAPSPRYADKWKPSVNRCSQMHMHLLFIATWLFSFSRLLFSYFIGIKPCSQIVWNVENLPMLILSRQITRPQSLRHKSIDNWRHCMQLEKPDSFAQPINGSFMFQLSLIAHLTRECIVCCGIKRNPLKAISVRFWGDYSPNHNNSISRAFRCRHFYVFTLAIQFIRPNLAECWQSNIVSLLRRWWKLFWTFPTKYHFLQSNFRGSWKHTQ